jgi:hypothetical protein
VRAERQVTPTTPGPDGATVDSEAGHREVIVRRLLDLDMSAQLLRSLLPAWSELIDRVATQPPPTQPDTTPG